MAKTLLPPGFRFHPTDVELVCYYLKKKVKGKPFQFEAISEIELYKFAPSELPDKSCLQSKDLEWYFFCSRDRKYPKGSRTNRATSMGYWKITGKDKAIIHNSHTVGMKRTLIFHEGKAPKGKRTNWVMHEYRLEDRELVNAGYSQEFEILIITLPRFMEYNQWTKHLQDTYVLCKIFKKSGRGPKLGEQYGAPFNEEDWEDDTTVENAFLFHCGPTLKPLDDQPVLFEPILQESVASAVCEVSSTADLPDADGMLLEQLPEILNDSPLHSEKAHNKISSSAVLDKNINEASGVETEIYDELEDLSAEAGINDNLNYSSTVNKKYELQPMLLELGSEQYVELNDLCFLHEGDPSDFVTVDELFDQDLPVENPGSLNLNNMHDHTFSFGSVTTAVMNDPRSVGTDMFDYGSTVFLNDPLSVGTDIFDSGSALFLNDPLSVGTDIFGDGSTEFSEVGDLRSMP